MFDKETEAQFQAHRVERDLKALRLVALMAMISFVGYSIFVARFVNERIRENPFNTALVLALLAGMFGATYLPIFRRHAGLLATIGCTAIGLAYILLFRVIPSPWQGNTWGALVMMLAVFYSTPILRPSGAATAGWLATLVFLRVAHTDGFHPPEVESQITGYLVVANFLGLWLAVLVDRGARRDFVAARELKAAREASESLLLNILPPSIAARLKAKGHPIADRHEQATVLFADLVGFTGMAATREPEMIVRLLDELFSCFDRIVDRHGVEKIKTIGDAYMAVGGLGGTAKNPGRACVEAALEMHEAVAKVGSVLGIPLAVRIGIASGPVVAGVIGSRKMLYDLWGDTVNTASRLETGGEPGSLLVCRRTRESLGGAFDLEAAPVVGKGKGLIDAYRVVRRRATSSAA